MRAEEGNAIWRTYYTVAFSLWTQSRREQIKEKVCFAGFVCFSTVTASEGGRGEGEERGTIRQEGRERGKEGGGTGRNTSSSVHPPWQLCHVKNRSRSG